MDAVKPQQQREEHECKASMEMKMVKDFSASREEADETVQNHPGWKAMPYVIGNETFEKLGTVGTLSNMLVYLTTVYHMQSVSAATLLSVFTGTSYLATVVGAFVSDTYLGRYNTLAGASISSFIGMAILTLTAAIHPLHPPSCKAGGGEEQCQGPSGGQLAALLVSFFFLVVDAGGIRPCNLAFGADQFDLRTVDGRRGIASFFNWYYFTYTIAMMVSTTVIIYLQSNVSWAVGLAVPGALMGVSCVVFFMGTRLYIRVRPEGSPLTSFTQVLVTSVRKRRLPLPNPNDASSQLFNPPHRSKLVSKLAYTDQFRCLDRAAALTPKDADCWNPWRLCTVQQVEEVKCLLRIIPVWSSGIVYFLVLTQLSTYTVLQAAQTDRRLGNSGYEIPQGSLAVFNLLAMTICIPVYDRLLVPALRRVTGREGGISQLQRIGIGFVLSIVTMVVAAAVERRRRSSSAPPMMMSCFWLVPQQVLSGLSEAFTLIGQTEFYYRQFPENMRSVAGALYFVAAALASYGSGLIITVVHRSTSWLAQDLDQGRVDLIYAVTAAMAALNVVYFLACARWYRFSKSDDDTTVARGGDATLV